MQAKYALRKRDVVTGILLFLASSWMLATAMTYPMTESYGGVKNAWYVSPALFPLMIAALLMVLSLALVGNGIRYIIHHRAEGDVDSLSSHNRAGFLFIVLTIGAFVYLYIPVVDFWIASLLFLYLFTAQFFLRGLLSPMPLAIAYVLLGVVLRMFGAMLPLEDTAPQYLRDLLCTAAFLLLVGYTVRLTLISRGELVPIRTVLVATVSTVTVLVVAFKYGVRLPMPREGLYCGLLDQLKFALERSFT